MNSADAAQEGATPAAVATPRLLRAWQIVTLAIFAELTYLLLVLVPLVPLLALQVFVYGPYFAAATGVVLAAGAWWVVQATGAGIEGESLPPGTPLEAEVQALCRRLQAPRIDRILVDDTLNAGAFQSHGFFSILGVKRTMVLGVPLLRMLEPDEARAVIAHELGHFSRQHGRLGHWVYLVRSKWDQYLYAPAQQGSIVDRGLKAIASWFVPRFVEGSSAWSKKCEFEADQLAADATSAQALGSALTRIEQLAHIGDTALQAHLHQLNKTTPTAPEAFWDVYRSIAAAAGDTDFESILAGIRARPSRLHDTHPPLPERLAALGKRPVPAPWGPGACAGEALLGAAWAPLYADCQRSWHDHAARAWRQDFVRLRWLEASIPADDIVRAARDDELTPSAETLNRLRKLAAQQPENAMARYWLGQALLRRNMRDGLAELRSAVRLDKRLAVRAREAICGYLEACGSDAESDAAFGRLRMAIELVDNVLQELWPQMLGGRLSAVPPDLSAPVSEAISGDRFVDACWFVTTEMADAQGDIYPVAVLVVRIDYVLLQESGMTEDLLRSRYGSMLVRICPPTQIIHVHTVLTTEAFNPRLLLALEKTPGACLREPASPINQNILKIDSL